MNDLFYYFAAGVTGIIIGYYLPRRKDDVNYKLHLIIKKLDNIMANEQQALDDLEAIKTQLSKIGTETATSLQKIIDLETAAQNAGVPQSILDKIAEVKAQAQVVDDLTPDA